MKYTLPFKKEEFLLQRPTRTEEVVPEVRSMQWLYLIINYIENRFHALALYSRSCVQCTGQTTDDIFHFVSGSIATLCESCALSTQYLPNISNQIETIFHVFARPNLIHSNGVIRKLVALGLFWCVCVCLCVTVGALVKPFFLQENFIIIIIKYFFKIWL